MYESILVSAVSETKEHKICNKKLRERERGIPFVCFCQVHLFETKFACCSPFVTIKANNEMKNKRPILRKQTLFEIHCLYPILFYNRRQQINNETFRGMLSGANLTNDCVCVCV